MSIDFSKYPVAMQLLEESGALEKADQIRYLDMTREEAAVELASLSLILDGMTSSDITKRKAAMDEVDNAYKRVGRKIHVFPMTQARSECNVSHEDVVRMFKHMELGGQRYL